MTEQVAICAKNRTRPFECGSRCLYLAAILFGPFAFGCGGGVPVRIVIDEFSMNIDLDDMLGDATADLSALVPGLNQLPEIWPGSLPEVKFQATLASPPISVDLTPEPGSPDAAKYEDINKVEEAIKRIELNRLVLRVDQSNLSIPLPQLSLQIASDADADPADRLAWHTIGTIESTPAAFVGDTALLFVPGGETFFNAQMADDAKDFSMRVRGAVELNLVAGQALPRGKATARLIVVATFFVDPLGAVKAAKKIKQK